MFTSLKKFFRPAWPPYLPVLESGSLHTLSKKLPIFFLGGDYKNVPIITMCFELLICSFIEATFLDIFYLLKINNVFENVFFKTCPLFKSTNLYSEFPYITLYYKKNIYGNSSDHFNKNFFSQMTEWLCFFEVILYFSIMSHFWRRRLPALLKT